MYPVGPLDRALRPPLFVPALPVVLEVLLAAPAVLAVPVAPVVPAALAVPALQRFDLINVGKTYEK